MVNTCGFVESAKKDSIDTLLAAADTGAKVVAVGCLAERYGEQLAEQLPEADAVLGFDAYAGLPDSPRRRCCAGDVLPSHVPGDRRKLLPISPVERARVMEPGDASVGIPGHAGGPDRRAPPARRTAPSRRSSSLAAATDAARSARSRASAARSSAAGPPTSWPRRAGWPSTACASWSW